MPVISGVAATAIHGRTARLRTEQNSRRLSEVVNSRRLASFDAHLAEITADRDSALLPSFQLARLSYYSECSMHSLKQLGYIQHNGILGECLELLL